MPKSFKLSSPLNQPSELHRAVREARQADQLAEYAIMRAFEVYRVHKFGGQGGSEKVISRLDRATEELGNARQALGDAVYQMETLLKEAGV